MGDGGVACVPLQHIMEKFPGSETLCGGTSSSNGNGKLETKSVRITSTGTKRMKLRRDAFFKKEEPEKVKSNREVENGGVSGEKVPREEQQEEMEEGELGTLKSPAREVENGEIEKGEIVSGKWRKHELEKDEFVAERVDRLRSNIVVRRNRTPEKYKRGDFEKEEFGFWRRGKDEIENGEFIPDRWRKDDYGYSKTTRRHHSSREREWRCEREWTPPSGRYSGEDVSPVREFSRSGSKRSKRSGRRKSKRERNYPKLGSKIVDESASCRNEYNRGKNHGREPSSSARMKRHGIDSDTSDLQYSDDHGEHASSKSRRLSGDSYRSSNSEHHSRRSAESHRNSSSSRGAFDKHSLRHHDSSSSSRAGIDRYKWSPSPSEHSPGDRARHHDYRDRDRASARHDRSPYHRGRHNDYRYRSPSYSERSPRDRSRRDRSPSYLERTPCDLSRPSNPREASTKTEVSETKQSKIQVKKLSDKDPNQTNSTAATKGCQDENTMKSESVETSITNQTDKVDLPHSPTRDCENQPLPSNGVVEEMASMEEDMDICDTPPHVPAFADVCLGKWYYVDHLGLDRGPSRLSDLKALVEGGILMSDHLIKHCDSDRWVTVENAASPMGTANYPTLVSDTITQLVTPPEAPGNLLIEAGDSEQPGSRASEEISVDLAQRVLRVDDRLGVPAESIEDLRIDERVDSLLEGVIVVPGKEMEIIADVLQMRFDQSEWERWGNAVGLLRDKPCSENVTEHAKEEDIPVCPETPLTDAVESTSSASVDKESVHFSCEFTEWFSSRWSCKGGDWRRNDEAVQDRFCRKKLVLNDGYPLCQMPKSGHEDPRWPRRDDLYYPSQSRKLDLPTWAFSCPDDRNDYNAVAKPGPPKPVVLRGVKGTFLPVVRINACVVKDHDSSVSEPRSRYRGKDRVSSKGIRHYSSSSDFRRSSTEDPPHLNSARERGSTRPWESAISINVPKDRLSTVEDLQLHLGGWYYLDGAGYERGPFLYSELQTLAERGLIEKQCSVFRKIDKVWVPVTPASSSPSGMKILEKDKALAGDSCWARNGTIKAATFHSLHPQFIGYTRGKLHELVMRSYKSREFAAAINEVLESWINTRQSKKEMEKHLYDGGPSFLNEDQMRAAKRARIITDGSQEEYGREEELSHPQIDDPSFEDLCSDVTFSKHELYSATNARSWGMLDGHILARVFHFLRADIKSLVFAASTCKHWRAAVGLYKNVSRQVNLSSFGSDCSNSILRSIMNGYNSDKIKSIVLIGCTNIGSGVLEEILCCFSCVSSVDIRGCSQLEELITKFPHLKWVVDGSSQAVRKFSDLHSKTRSLRQITDKASSVSKLGLGSYVDDSSGLKDYFDMVDKRNAANQAFRQSLYKRTKVFDARKSATVLSRDARIRRWTMKKPANVYKQMEDFLLVRLRDIMKENTCDFFVPRVGEIEGKIKSGYYARSGLSFVKEDINKMCRDATKMKTRSDGDVERIIALFIKLAARIGQMSKAAVNRGTMNALKDELSGSSEYGKYGKNVTERKYKKKVNGGPDGTEYSSDLEIRRRVSKLDRKLDSGSDSSDEFESSDDEGSDGASSASGAESDLGVRSESGACDTSIEEALDSSADDREWGARMTKASLVPPVTRKYDVIDQYVIVADEEEVQRKMRVSLPDDYDDRAKAQKNGTEELDMELPEVKDFKPRKQLGEEVIEQEVYGIDPYTHNLLLDSIPDDGDWPLTEKHHFVEDALLRVLNKQVRQFTGSRYTPMTYPLKPVIKEILQTAKEEDDMKTLKLCDAILKAMDSRLEDNYVAYRKGLGVVCNKEGGFGRDDFVVEFLGEVYPAWKWFEKQDGIRSLQKNSKDPAPEFYNIYLERPKGDADGYDLVVVDAMHKANYASRICHSCQPNCEAKVTAVDGYYQIGIYSVRPIAHGEEITFDYNSVTESKEEYEASVCLCGSQVCRGSYLNLTGEGAFQKVLKEWHGLLDKHRLLIEACELNWVSEEDYIELGKAGLGSCLLGGLPDWVIAYSARLVRFINFERTRLPEAILKHNLEEKSKYFVEICHELEKSDAEIEAEGVYNQRLQNLALTLDKVRYVLRCVFGDPKRAPPPLQRLGPEEMVSFLWKGEGSLVEELLQCIAPHIDNRMLEDLKSKIRAHDPSGSSDVEKELRKSLLWLRDEVRNLPCTNKSRHDGAADLIHVYAYTKSFFRIREYKSVTSPPVYISPLDLGPKYADKLSGITEYCKTYGDNYCLGQLIYWYNQANAEPEHALARASRGCLSLPDIGSFYAMPQKPPRQRVYGPRTVRFMVSRMEKQPQRPWPSDRIWSFKTSLKIFGSPMLDAVLNNAPLEREMMVWLKNRPAIFHAMWDR